MICIFLFRKLNKSIVSLFTNFVKKKLKMKKEPPFACSFLPLLDS